MSTEATAANQLAQVPALLIAGGHLHLAEQLYREALEAWEVHGGRPSTKAATFLNNLAHIIGELGKVDEAEALYRRAIEMWTATLDEGGEGLVATGLNNLAGLLKYKGELKEAHELYEKALDMDEKLWGSSHPDVATDLNNFASLLKVEGALDDSFRFFDRAVAIYEASFASKNGDAAGLIHPWLAVSLNNLGELSRHRGDLTRAEVCLKRAVEIFEKAGTVTGGSGSDRSSSSLATSVHNLARCYHDQQRHAEAEAAYLRALTLWKRGNAAPGKSKAGDVTALAVAAFAAPEKSERVVSPQSDSGRGENMQSVRSNGLAFAAGLNNLGSLKHANGDHVAARRLYERSIALREELHGSNHLSNLAALNNQSRLSHDRGDSEVAERLQRRCMGVCRGFGSDGYGLSVTQAATCMNNLASILQDNEYRSNSTAPGVEEDGDAMALYRRAIGLLEQDNTANGTVAQSSRSKKTQQPEAKPSASVDLATACNNLGSLLAQRGRPKEARPFLERSHRMLDEVQERLSLSRQKLPGAPSWVDHPQVAKTRMNLVMVLWRLGEFDEALRLIENARAARVADSKMVSPQQRGPAAVPAQGDVDRGSSSEKKRASSRGASPPKQCRERSEAVLSHMLRSRLPYPY